ncbi:hypothetical protein BFW01_g11586 [Lasiodiplodia theobromae]|nr:hypothetical protein BFW01_g11586 [Lasiodiplodia theobromae]
MTEAQYLKKACSLLYKSNSNEVKDTVILTDEFLEPFQFFRDEWMWHPRKTLGGRGPGVNTTASLVSSEYRNGFNSKYTSLRGYDIETSGWKDSDFYIFTILRVLQSFQISGKPLHTGRSTAYNIEQAAKGVHLALSAVISWYNPSRQSAMAQLIEARLPPSRHTAQSSKLKSKSNITSPVSDIICYIWAGRVTLGRNGVFSHIDYRNAPQPAVDQGGDPAARLWLEGETEDVGLDENEEVQTTISTPSISRSTTPSDGPASKRPRTRA